MNDGWGMFEKERRVRENNASKRRNNEVILRQPNQGKATLIAYAYGNPDYSTGMHEKK